MRFELRNGLDIRLNQTVILLYGLFNTVKFLLKEDCTTYIKLINYVTNFFLIMAHYL